MGWQDIENHMVLDRERYDPQEQDPEPLPFDELYPEELDDDMQDA